MSQTQTGRFIGTGRLNQLGTRPLTPPAGPLPVERGAGARMTADATSISSTARARTAPLAAPPPGGFHYRPLTFHKVEGALAWPEGTMTGTDANNLIVKGYADLEKSFIHYMGEPKEVANWLTFGKYAGREAGVSIDRVEKAIEALEDFDLAAGLESLVESVLSPIMTAELAVPLFQDALEQAREDERKLGKPMSAWDFCGNVVGHVLDNLKQMRQGLVSANVCIYKNFAPAFDAFLRVESQGGDGLAAVQRQVDAGQVHDPDGLIRGALGLYRDARELADEARLNPPNKADLLARREETIKRGNMLIAMQEQYHVAQRKSFDDPTFQRLVGKLTPELGLTDANGRHKLLPNGGNWADFATRMGFEELSAVEAPAAARRFTSNSDLTHDVFRLTDPQGKTRFFRPQRDARKLEGTVSGVFAAASTGTMARRNMAKDPEPIPTYVPGQAPKPVS